MSGEVGRPSQLTEEMTVRIRDCILDGKTQKETAAFLGINENTFEGWVKRNYDGFADTLLTYKHQRLLNKAERNIEQALDMDTDNVGATMKGEIYTFRDPKLEQIKTSTAVFVSETLGRKNFHKKKELDHTGVFKTYEIIRGDADSTRFVSATSAGVAQVSAVAVESVPVQDSSSGAQSAENNVHGERTDNPCNDGPESTVISDDRANAPTGEGDSMGRPLSASPEIVSASGGAA